MSTEEGNFEHGGIPCCVSIQDANLVIKGVSQNETQSSTLVIPFPEILTVNVIGEEGLQDKRTLNLKRNVKLPHIAVKTVKRHKDHRWRLTTVKLKSKYETLCQQWAKMLLQKLSEFQDSRPRSLLVFVNPFGGNGSAKSVYNKKVKPIFEEAKIKTKVIVTSFRHHAKTFIEMNDLSEYDGIVAVGGDGMLNEVVNGLISLTQLKNGISVNAKNGNPRSCPEYLRPSLRVAVIPAGSTDCVSYVTQGINDAETSALHIVLGDSHPVDVVSLHNADGVFQQFSMSLTGYGYFGDMLRHSENYRWMGPPRYVFVGANVFLRNKSYSGEVHYLPAEVEEDPARSSFCRTPCSVCKGGLDSESQLFTPITPNASFENHFLSVEETNGDASGTLTSKSDATVENLDSNAIFETELTRQEDENEDLFAAEHKLNEIDDNCEEVNVIPDQSNGTLDERESNEIIKERESVDDNSAEKVFDIMQTSGSEYPPESDGIVMKSDLDGVVTPPKRPGTLSLSQDSGSQHDHEEWQVIRGDFMSVKGVAMSCACEKCPLGLSPYSHLSDGAIDLIVVKSCSRFEFLRYMIALSGKSDRFHFPFVEVYRVKAFQFIPSTPQIQSLEAPPSRSASPSRSVTAGSNTDTSCSESVHISLDNLRVKYQKGKDKKGRRKKKSRGLRRSQSLVTNRVSTWNSDGEIVSDANMTVRVHRGLILMFCRGVEEFAGH